ncbi:hypothetical protein YASMINEVIRUS_1448 [Yasminevirus sp. GU-2018]|uniref:Uncharacterized protein n=1 Tax=Yasminevirus sp. GU-2018 TaxID=2420051 RepID=A0A5K0UC68_9VIRU|nr:hypothetical protein YASMINEVIRUS_1448 [Yasminevirus sp. GU-2018]
MVSDWNVLILLLCITSMLIFIYFNEDFSCGKIENMDPDVDAKSNEAIQGIYSIYNKDTMVVNTMTTNSLNSPVLKSTGDLALTGKTITLTGDVCSGGVCMKATDFMKTLSRLNKIDYMYSNDNYAIYNDILAAIAPSPSSLSISKPIAKYGNPPGFDNTTYTTSRLWNRRTIMRVGYCTDGLNGVIVYVPANMSVIWIRCLNDRWTTFKVSDEKNNTYGTFSWGKRYLTWISPDGSGFDTYANYHSWMPIALPIIPTPAGALNVARKYVITNPTTPTCSNDGSWISGIGFSTNPWNHALSSALTLWWKNNGGDDPTSWSENQNNDPRVTVGGGQTKTFYIPVVYSGKDKLLYVVTDNDARNDNMAFFVKVNDVAVERFKSAYDNPFSRHYNKNEDYSLSDLT